MQSTKSASQRSAALLFSCVTTISLLVSGAACAEEKTKLLHSFGVVGDGAQAQGVIRAPDGTMYGTTSWGGTGCGASGCGSVFEITQKKETILHSFDGQDGQFPHFPPVLDGNGNLFGTTFSGGNDGVVFKLTPDGSYTVVYTFTGASDGGAPQGIAIDSAGNLFGIANGGLNNDGVLYEITSQGQFKILYSFGSVGDARGPDGTPVLDEKGNIFGVTAAGGTSGYGTIYKLTAKGEEKVLHSFSYEDGCVPLRGVVRDDDGNLYGTTSGCVYGFGTLYKLSPSGRFTVLHAFGGATVNDGLGPVDPPTLVKNAQGNVELYGTTTSGGSNNDGIAYMYWGKGHYKIIHNFAGSGPGSSDAGQPMGSLVVGVNGKLYGASQLGGSEGAGTVFELSTR